ncbi:MAG: glycerol-3-phosphate 1-O-acyltransferase PlsY [Pseudomonadota bacterium]
MVAIILSAGLGYLLGSIPFGLVITKAAGLGDIRTIGSGNIGATNVLRTGRKDLAAATLILDSGKGAIAVFLAMYLGLRPEVAGAMAFLGHCFPVWLRFNGGKGVATFLGTLLAIQFWAGLIACLIWLAVARLSKISSLSALTAAAFSPMFVFVTGHGAAAIATLFMASLIFMRHRDNIRRLLLGTEPKIGDDKKSNGEDGIGSAAGATE